MREDRRRRYDDGFRREALELIKSGAGGDTLARRLAMPRQTAENWIGLYRSGGEEAVMGGGGSRRYDWETKVAAARDHVENGLTKAEVMAMHGIASVAPLERWCREYRSGGPEALGPRPKGRPRGSRSRPKPEPTREQELAKRVRPPAGAHVPGPRVRHAHIRQDRAQGHAPYGAEMRHPFQEPVETLQLVQGRDGRPRA
jgi:transposase